MKKISVSVSKIKKGSVAEDFIEIKNLIQSLENKINEMKNLCIDTEEIEDIIEDAKESQQKHEFYNAKKLLERCLGLVEEYKSNYLAINLSDMISTTHLRITKVDAVKRERDALLKEIKKAKKYFMKKKYEKTETILKGINRIIDQNYNEIDSTRSPEKPILLPESSSETKQSNLNESTIIPLVEQSPPESASHFEVISIIDEASQATPPVNGESNDEIDLSELTNLDDLDKIFDFDNELGEDFILSDEKVSEDDNEDKRAEYPLPPPPPSPPARSDTILESQALDDIQKIQSIITDLQNFGANTVILERLSTKAKEAFKKNDYDAIKGYVRESEDISKKVRIGYMESLMNNVDLNSEELGYLEYLIQQTEEAYERGILEKAEECSSKYKEIIIDLMKNNGKYPSSTRNFEFCRFCGESVPIDSTYCSKCGEKLK
jgi:hypothetical protein